MVTGRSLATYFAGLLRVAGFGTVGSVMAERDFRLFTIGHAVNLPGLWIYRVALAWLTWELTHSGTWLGIIAAADALPALFLTPLGGALADRLDRRKLALATQVIQVIISLVLAVLTLFGAIGIIGLLILTVLRGINLSFWQPVRLTLVPNLVSRQHLGTAIALNATIFNTSFFIGPAIAGPLILLGGAGLAFAVDFASSGFFLAMLLATRFRAPKPSGVRRNVFIEIGQGLGFAFRHPGIRPLLFLGAVSSLGVRPVTELLAGFADLSFSGGAGTLSALTAALGFGALVGAIWIIRSGDNAGISRHLLRAGLTASAAVGVFVATGIFALALVALAFAGFGFALVGVLAQTLLQQAVPDGMRGRVLSIHGLIMRAGPGIGAMVMGVSSGAIGLRLPVAIGVIIAAAIYAHAWTRRHHLAQMLAQVHPATGAAVHPGSAPG
ncbi:MAG: MFS transporter [Alphaproteobacteria bacterium]